MDVIELRPEKEQKTLWFISWAVPTVTGVMVLLILSVFIPRSEEAWLVFPILLIILLVVTGLILLWIPAFYKSLEYVINSDCMKAKKGVLWKKSVTVPFMKITNVDVIQGPLQRVFDIGTINVQTAGAGGPEGAKAELKLLGVRDLEGVKETIMERVRGYRPSSSEQMKERISKESDTEILGRMLKELTVIRELLQNRGN